MTDLAGSGTLVDVQDSDVAEVASVLRDLLARVDTGEMVAGPGLVARIEAAIATLEGLTNSGIDRSQQD